MIQRVITGAMLALLALPVSIAAATTVEATRTLRSGTIIHPADLRVMDGDPKRTEIESIEQAVGMEVRASIRQGRRIRTTDLRHPVLIKRNQLVDIVYRRGSLVIRGEGRALRDGSKGEAIRVMNLDSRVIVTGRVRETGKVEVSR